MDAPAAPGGRGKGSAYREFGTAAGSAGSEEAEAMLHAAPSRVLPVPRVWGIMQVPRHRAWLERRDNPQPTQQPQALQVQIELQGDVPSKSNDRGGGGACRGGIRRWR